MTQAQKTAKAKFKEAIAYRQKTGVTLKEAFAHIYGKKTATKKVAKKVAKKRIGKVDNKLKKTLAKKGKKMPHGYDVVKRTRKISGTKKYTIVQLRKLANDTAYATGGDLDKLTYRLLDNPSLAPKYKKAILDFEKKHKIKISGVKKKRITETGILNRIHNVKKSVDKLDEAQHKHMSKLGAVSSHLIHEVKEAHNKLIHWQKALMMLENTRKTLPASMKKYNSMDIKRVKEAIKEQKTHIAQLKKHIK